MNRPPRDLASLSLALAGLAALAYAAWRPSSPDHPVTALMVEAAGAMAGRPAPALVAVGTDGRPHSIAAAGRPLVLFFIQDGCPCSEAAAPHFGRVAAAYAGRADFLGVIDADLAAAREWSGRHGASYPILADPSKRIIAACRAERSAYVMLVASDGAVEVLWPGYSAGMLADLGARLARLARQAEVPLDLRGAPTEMVSGCRF